MEFNFLPLVSVVIPVFNGAEFLSEAIDSAFSQSYSKLEVIVIDDGSTDDSYLRICKYRDISYKKQPNSGPALARNYGCQLARGELVAFLDQDDIWLPQKLEKQVACFVENPDLGSVLCHQETRFERDHSAFPLSVGMSVGCQEHVAVPSFSPSALMMRTGLLRSLGGFNENYPLYSEAEIFLRLRETKTPIEVLPEVLLVKRFHQTNLSYRTQHTSRELLGIARDSVRRKGNGDNSYSKT